MTIKQAEKIVKALEGIDIDISVEDIKDIETFDDLDEYLADNDLFNVEIIYYSNAMEYLIENDPSLREALGLAHDMGYEPKNLNSELLASLLASENVRSDFYDLKGEIETLLEEQA
jgi:hypothetical protein